MVSLISIGIVTYANKDESSLNNIPCAYDDAKKIYDVFEKILGKTMKKYASASLKDITALEFKALLSTIHLSIEADDILILYFSGHGYSSSNGKLKLAFTDYSDSRQRGVIAISEIVSMLSHYHCKIVLILDCCYSGASLVESNLDDVRLENSISIMASNGAISKAKFTEKGSEFTAYLCDAMEDLNNVYEDISLNSLYSIIQKKYKKCQIIIGGGDSDIFLKRNSEAGIPKDFIEKFINKVDTSNYEMREALWYALGYFPEPLKVELITRYKKKNGMSIGEMSWRVRRAIGSISRTNITESGQHQVEEFLNSPIWMERCIGYISVHKMNNNDIACRLKEELQKSDNPMDLVWLSTLYLSEREPKALEYVLNTKLMKTAWGTIEVWKRYLAHSGSQDCISSIKPYMGKETFKEFCLELYFRGKSDNIDFNEYCKEIYLYKEEFKELYSIKPRGQFKESKVNKWIFSILYGNWRDQVDLSGFLENKFKHMRDKDKRSYLRALKYIPSVEIKMAILDFFVTKLKEVRFSKYKDELIWALEDKHPWVIRTALPLFCDKPDLIQEKIQKNIDIYIYPGVFDLAIELCKQGLKKVDYNIENMTDIEETQLKIAMDNE